MQKCFVWENGQPSTCTQEIETCNNGECLFKCTCTSDDPNNLSAKVCNSETDECQQDCDSSVCGAWEDWTDWTDCSVSCGGGNQSRSRCFIWSDLTKSKSCENETKKCAIQTCPGWGEWSGWGACEAKCLKDGKSWLKIN